MKTRVKGLYAAEDLIGIAQRLMARLQDAGVTHVRDVSVYYTTTDVRGETVEIGTIAGPVDELSLRHPTWRSPSRSGDWRCCAHNRVASPSCGSCRRVIAIGKAEVTLRSMSPAP